MANRKISQLYTLESADLEDVDSIPIVDDSETQTKRITIEELDSRWVLPAGVIVGYAPATIPEGWLLCDGSAVSRTTYATLFAAVGTEYGAGDGSTTFNLPNTADHIIKT